MKYTNNDIQVGTIFGSISGTRWEVTRIGENNCDFHGIARDINKYSEYDLHIIVKALNLGTWQLYTSKTPEYEIY